MAENGAFGTPFLAPEIARKSLSGSIFAFFPGNEAHKLLPVVLGGGQKVYVEKVYVLFLPPI